MRIEAAEEMKRAGFSDQLDKSNKVKQVGFKNLFDQCDHYETSEVQPVSELKAIKRLK